jgi:hypothetical protein
MVGLVPTIHALLPSGRALVGIKVGEDVDARDKPEHDGVRKNLCLH